MTGSAGSAAMLTQQVAGAQGGNLAAAIPRESFNSNGLNVATVQSATLSPRTAAQSYVSTKCLHSRYAQNACLT